MSTELVRLLRAAVDCPGLFSGLHDCHAKGLDSIVLRRFPSGGMLRVFVAHEVLPLWAGGTFVIGAHDHRFNIVLHRLYGSVENIQVAAVDRNNHSLLPAHEFRFQSALTTGQFELTHLRDVALRLVTVPIEVRIRMPFDAAHTVRCPAGAAAWAVYEGCERQAWTRFYSLHRNPVLNSSGMYRPMSAASISDVCATVLRRMEEL